MLSTAGTRNALMRLPVSSRFTRAAPACASDAHAFGRVWVSRGTGAMCTSQGLIPGAPNGPHSTSSTTPTTADDATLRRCPRATVGAPDDDLIGQTIQPAFVHIVHTPVAHPRAKPDITAMHRRVLVKPWWRNVCTFEAKPRTRGKELERAERDVHSSHSSQFIGPYRPDTQLSGSSKTGKAPTRYLPGSFGETPLLMVHLNGPPSTVAFGRFWLGPPSRVCARASRLSPTWLLHVSALTSASCIRSPPCLRHKGAPARPPHLPARG